MVESIKCTQKLPDEHCFEYKVTKDDCLDFKNYVSKTFSFYKSSDFMQFSIDKKSNVLRQITNNREKIVSENWIYLKEQKIKKSCATSMCHTA